MRSIRNKVEFFLDIPIPVGVELVIMKKQPFRGCFCTPETALKMGYKKYPTIIIDYRTGRDKSTLIHEIGHFLHWRKTKFAGKLQNNTHEKERQATIFGLKWYRKINGHCRGLRCHCANLAPFSAERAKKLLARIKFITKENNYDI